MLRSFISVLGELNALYKETGGNRGVFHVDCDRESAAHHQVSEADRSSGVAGRDAEVISDIDGNCGSRSGPRVRVPVGHRLCLPAAGAKSDEVLVADRYLRSPTMATAGFPVPLQSRSPRPGRPRFPQCLIVPLWCVESTRSRIEASRCHIDFSQCHIDSSQFRVRIFLPKWRRTSTLRKVRVVSFDT